jgi:hypothetical protein
MTSARLSALDASFLAVETSTAHMHVGWVALFSADPGGPLPSFATTSSGAYAARRDTDRSSPRYRSVCTRRSGSTIPLSPWIAKYTGRPARSAVSSMR